MKKPNKLLSCLGLIACLAGIPQAAFASIAGHVQFVSGKVQVTDQAGQTRAVQKGDAINEGDTLTSAPKSSAQIKMQDGGFVAVRPDTRLKFDQFVFAGKEDGNEKSFFSLFKGGFRAVTGLIGRLNKQNYKITTPAATIGIRGTDHETFLITPDSPLAQVAPTGAYNKVNVGETYVATDKGIIFVQPNQMGFAGGMDQAPKVQPINTKIFTVAEAAEPGAKTKKKEEKAEAKQEQAANGDQEEKQEEAKDEQQAAEGGETTAEAGSETAAEGEATAEGGTAAEGGGTTAEGGTATAQDAGTQEQAAPVRETAVVDAAPPSTGGAPAATAPTVTTTTTIAAVVAPPPASTTTTTLTTAAATGGTTANLITGTATTAGGQTITVTQSVAAAQAQAAADAALAAATAAAAAATAAQAADTALAAIAPVSVTPATTAIGTATTAVTAANTAVTATAALAPANATTATTNANSVQTIATTAAGQATTAQAVLDANGVFADSTAGAANTTVQTANTTLQIANTTVQTAAVDVATQNAVLTTAQGAAAVALSNAMTSLDAASIDLGIANTQNTAITDAQAATPAQVTAVQTAAVNAQTAAAAAQLAADEAAIFQAAGNLAGAQAQLVIAQQQLAIAQAEQTAALAAQTTVDTQLAAAQAAATAAATAVTAATTSADTATANATTADTQAGAAQTAALNAAAAFAQTDPAVISPSPSAANTVQTSSATIAANAPIAAYNNPAVVTADRFVGNMITIQPDATSGYVEGYGPGAGFDGIGTANTDFVLDGSGNLVESRHTWYEETPASTATPQVVVVDANVKRTGGTAVETFKMADNSIYAGRWIGGTITVSDNNPTPIPTFSRNLGVTSEHWAIMLTPPVGYVQTLVGAVSYSKVAATSPTDALGNAGTLNTASLTADFTSQLVHAALNLTISGKTLDVAAANMAIGGYNFSTATQVTATCTGCGAATYYANVGGGFAGDAAASAGLSYTLWTGAAPGATTGATDIIQGMAAFGAATAPVSVPIPMAVTGNLPVWPDLYAYEVVATGGVAGAYILLNPWDELLANTVYGLDAANNLLEVNQQPQLGNREYFSGGTAQDTWVAPDGSVYMGRWQGGNITTVDYLGGLVGTTALGAGSAHWIASAQTPPGFAQTLAGVDTYTLAAATAPTDALGNTGTLLGTSTVMADFTAQLVNIVLNVEFTGTRTSAFTVTTPGGIPIVTDTIWGMGAVACAGANCDAGGYSADLWPRFAGSTASNVALAYHIVANSMTDIIQGAASFGSTGVVQLLPYIATNTAVAYTGSFGGSFNYIAGPGDLSPAGNPSYFREMYGDGSGFRTDTLVNPTTAVTPATVYTALNSTPITYGVWESAASVDATEEHRIGPGKGGGQSTLPVYMYGAEGYVDSAVVAGTNTGPLTGAYSYTAQASTSFNSDTWTTGSVTTATLSANFTNQTVSVALAGVMGAEAWAATSTNAPITFFSTANGAGARFFDSSPVVTMNAAACPTCGGNINGAFVGQNYAGAIVQYNIWDNSPILGMNAGGLVGFSRDTAVADLTPVPTGSYVLANSWQLESPTAIGVNGASVLTSWSGGGASTTVMPAAGSVAEAAIGTGSGTINWGTWGAESTFTSSFSYVPGSGQLHWITAPEPTPIYLAEVLLTTNAAYNFVGGDVTSLTGGGVHGTGLTASLTANFTAQTVSANLAFLANGHSWAASASNAPLHYLSNGNSLTGFYADSWNPAGLPGALTVTVDGQAAQGSLTGQLVGAALDGAILKFNFDGQGTTGGYEYVQGVAALQAAAAHNPATDYRMLATAYNDPTALAPTVMLGGAYNNAARVGTDGSGNLVQFDDNSVNHGHSGSGVTIQHVSGTFAELGSAVIGGATVTWGRWAPDTVVTVTDRATGTSQNLTLASGAHAVVGPLMNAPVALPTAGVYGYTLVGNTTPTTDTGAAGTLNSASLQANFSTQTVNVGVNVTAAGATLGAAASNVPIQNRAMFFADSRMTGAGALAVTCTGTCGTLNHGAIGGGFSGTAGAAAGITYGFEKQGANAGTVAGVAVFQQGAAIPQ